MESPEAEDIHFKVENDMQLKHGLFSSEEHDHHLHSRSHEEEEISSNGNMTFKDDQFWFNPGLLKVNWTKVIIINCNKSMTTEQMESLISRSGICTIVHCTTKSQTLYHEDIDALSFLPSS